MKMGLRTRIKAKLLRPQIKMYMKQLDKVEKELDEALEKYPELRENEEFMNDYYEIKKAFAQAREHSEKIMKKEKINMDEYVAFLNEMGELFEKLGGKYGVKNYEEKARKLKSVHIDKTADTFDASELSEEELKKLAEELKKKKIDD